MAGRTYKTGVDGKVKTAAVHRAGVAPAFPLTDAELEYFKALVLGREMATWSPGDVLTLTHLAQNYRRLKQITDQLDHDGFTQVNSKGTQISHPLFTAMVQTTMLITSTSKALGITAPQRGLNSPEQKQRNKHDLDQHQKQQMADDATGMLLS